MRLVSLHMTPRSVVIADREPTTTARLASLLLDLGHHVAATTSSGAEAVAATASQSPALVLLGATLDGERDGFETASEIRRASTVPILFTVAESDRDAQRRAAAAGMSGWLLVPFADRELRATVAAAMAGGADAPATQLEERFFDIAMDLLCCLGFNGHFQRLNPAWERTLGYTRDELMSRPFIEFVHPDDRDRTLNQNRSVRGGGQALGFENRYRCKDGSYRWFRWNATSEQSHGIIYSVARDITAQKVAEEERERLAGRLQVAMSEVRQLRAILPICSYCKRIRDDTNYWHAVEEYISRHTNTRFSHGICPSCYEQKILPQLAE